MKPDDFLKAVGPYAQGSANKAGIFASVVLAQAALESGWGAKAPGNNLFGIKADKSWTGPTVTFGTHEVLQSQRIAMPDTFRAYPDWGGAFDDHAAFLVRNPRYKPVLAAKTPDEACKALQSAGYSTSPTYAATLMSIIKSHTLTQYD